MSMTESVDLPECKIPVTVNPSGFVRFAVSADQADRIYEQLKEDYQESSGDELVTVRFVMDRAAYGELMIGLEEIEDRLPQAGLKQVNLTSTPEYALTVLLDAEQISNTATATSEALGKSNADDLYSQEFRISENAAVLAIRQLEEAFDGASNPVEEINIDKIRQNNT